MFEKKSNIIYIIFLSVVVFITALFFTAISLKKEKTDYSVDYNTTISLGDYIAKITNGTYVSDTKELYFYLSTKQNNSSEHSSSEPQLNSLRIAFRDKKGNERKENLTEKNEISKINDMTYKVSMADISDDYLYVYIEMKSVREEYQDEDTIDEFGNTQKGEVHKKEEYIQYVIMDRDDITVISSSDDNEKPVTSISFEKPKETENKIETRNMDNSSDAETTRKSTERYSKTETSITENTGKNTSSVTQSTTGTNANTTSKNNGGGGNNRDNSVTTTAKTTMKSSASTTKSSTTTAKTTVKTTTKTTTKAATTTVNKATVKIEMISLKTNYPSNNVTLNVGQSAKVEVVISPANATDKSVVWSSSRTDVAIVDSAGNIKAVGTGKAIIVVKTKNGAMSAACMVTVS